jgi:hypothetical protein
MFQRQHGNTRHGRYSKRNAEDLQMVRILGRLLRGGCMDVPVLALGPPKLRGWSVYRRLSGLHKSGEGVSRETITEWTDYAAPRRMI